MSFAGALFLSWEARIGEDPEFLLDSPNRISPKSNEFNPDSDTREAIANFATSLNFHIRARQAKSQIYDRPFRKMCRSVHEHAMRAQVRGTHRNFARSAFIVHVKLREVLDSRLATRGRGRSGGRHLARALLQGLQESTPSEMLRGESGREADPSGPRRVPQ